MKNMSTCVALISVFGCASVPASSPPPGAERATQATAAVTGNLYASIPAAVGDFKLMERAAVSEAPADSLFRYSDGSRTNLTVFIYDVPDEVKVDNDAQKWTAREGEKFREIQEVQKRRGRIADYQVAFSDTTRQTRGAHSILEHRIATPVRFPNGAIAVDFQFLYLIGGKFVKVRATVPEQGWEQTNVPSFARELALRLARNN